MDDVLREIRENLAWLRTDLLRVHNTVRTLGALILIVLLLVLWRVW